MSVWPNHLSRSIPRRHPAARSLPGTIAMRSSLVTLLLGIVLILGSCSRAGEENGGAAGAGTAAGRRASPSPPLELAVMSFNIRYGTANDGPDAWPRRRETVFALLRGEAPDLIGVQEALRFQLDEIAQAVSGYGEIGVGRDDGLEAGEYAAILYATARLRVLDSGTFWLSDTPAVPGSMSWGNSITRICTWARFAEIGSGRAFYLFNLHLDHRSQLSRERSVELLAERIAVRLHPDPVIVTGDFNAGEENPAILYLTGKRERAVSDTSVAAVAGQAPTPPRLRDTFRVLHPEADEVGTFNGFRGDTAGEKIDFVFVDEAWDVLSAAIRRTAVGGRYPSDHFPVTARLRLP